MATLKQIAAEAGVSVMTVSNVIHNNRSKVSPATVEKVQQLIEKYHYVPNMAARSLIAKESHIIAVLLPLWNKNSSSLLLDPYAGQLTSLIETLLRERGYYIMLCSFETVEQALTTQQNWQMDGAVMVLPHRDDITRAVLDQATTPLVIIDRWYEDKTMLSVTADDRKGGYIAARHLLQLGHSRIGFASPGMAQSSIIQDRYQGFCQALMEYGLAPEKAWMFFDYHNTFPEAADYGAWFVAQPADGRPTAMVCTEDSIAVEIVKSVQGQGLRVPEALSVVGYDDSMPARLISPALTTVRQDIRQKAEYAVELLMDKIADPEIESRRRILDVDLVYRESVADIREKNE